MLGIDGGNAENCMLHTREEIHVLLNDTGAKRESNMLFNGIKVFSTIELMNEPWPG